MSKTYVLQDGGKITATCAADFVKQLREGSKFDFNKSDADYMRDFTNRYRDLIGKDVRQSSPEDFLEDLLRYGYLAEE